MVTISSHKNINYTFFIPIILAHAALYSNFLLLSLFSAIHPDFYIFFTVIHSLLCVPQILASAHNLTTFPRRKSFQRQPSAECLNSNESLWKLIYLCIKRRAGKWGADSHVIIAFQLLMRCLHAALVNTFAFSLLVLFYR
jgi:hypothetical protein